MAGMTPGILRELDELPSWFLTAEVADLERLAGGPTLIRLRGKQAPPLFVSVLLHGNERTGFLAVQRWLDSILTCGKPLARDLVLFLGNLPAARQNLRRLPDGPDFNRIWREPPPALAPMVERVLSVVRDDPPFAAIDIHNNSGWNPSYACVSHWERRHLHLAALFGRLVVHTDLPRATLTHVISDTAPSVTLECGRSGEEEGIRRAAEFLDACAHLSAFPDHGLRPGDVEGYRTLARIRIAETATFAFSGECDRAAYDLVFRSDLDRLNFQELPAGTVLGTAPGGSEALIVEDPLGKPTPLLEVRAGKIVNSRPLVPAMLTVSVTAVRDDCLGYVMERLTPP